jgi:RHS repeat-associated protein
MEIEDANRTFTYSHDENGQRKAKHLNGQRVEAYEWLDFVRLAAFHDGKNAYEFEYKDESRTPHAMRRDNDTTTYLFHDQAGSLRVVADTSGNVIKEILYDPFGGIIKDTNPDLRIPIGFAGGLHDRDLGFVRFGWRDYDTFTGRWTAPDPLGDKGGDSDWYGYCLDDPINGVDPLGLFRFGKRGLGGLPLLGLLSDNPLSDKLNIELAHEHGFYEDGTGDNIGFFKDGPKRDPKSKDYKIEEKQYDDKRMKRSQNSIDPGQYRLWGIGGKQNNCQDFSEKLRKRYHLLERGDRQR